MDRRGLRAIVVLVAVAVVGLVLVVARDQPGRPTSAAGATGGPHSSMAGPTTSALIGPTAIPGSSKRYGMLLADNGSPWYVTGTPNAN